MTGLWAWGTAVMGRCARWGSPWLPGLRSCCTPCSRPSTDLAVSRLHMYSPVPEQHQVLGPGQQQQSHQAGAHPCCVWRGGAAIHALWAVGLAKAPALWQRSRAGVGTLGRAGRAWLLAADFCVLLLLLAFLAPPLSCKASIILVSLRTPGGLSTALVEASPSVYGEQHKQAAAAGPRHAGPSSYWHSAT